MLSSTGLQVVEHATCTDPGPRPANEDAVAAQPPLFAVADGVGGGPAGGLAAGIAIEVLTAPEGPNDLAERALLAHRRIRELAEREPDRHAGMATTLTAARVDGNRLDLVHAGDSRAYRLRDGSMQHLTEDHSLAQELHRAGTLDTVQAARHPQRSVITRALGQPDELELDRREHELADGDVVLLCSDGLTDALLDADVQATIDGGDTLEEAARALVGEANRRGGRDNVSVVLFRVGRAD